MKKKATKIEVEDSWDEDEDESSEADDESEDSDEDEKPKGKKAPSASKMEEMFARAFYRAIKRVKAGKIKTEPPKKPEKGLFETISEMFGVDE